MGVINFVATGRGFSAILSMINSYKMYTQPASRVYLFISISIGKRISILNWFSNSVGDNISINRNVIEMLL